MNKIDYLSNEMAEETLKEAADTFFGKRKKIDDEIELLREQAKKIQAMAKKIRAKASGLNFMLLDQDWINKFWARLGLGESVYPSIKGEWKGKESMPWAMTIRGRYQKAVLSLYQELGSLVRDYTHGRYIDHPSIKGKKVITPNFSSLKTWAESINRDIEAINCSSRPDDVMSFTRRMNVEEDSKREQVGSGLEYKYDEQLCLTPVDFDSLELEQFPELPFKKSHLETVRDLCRSICTENKERVRAVLDRTSS